MMGVKDFLTTYCLLFAAVAGVFFKFSETFCFAFSPGALAIGGRSLSGGSLGGVKSKQFLTT